MSSVILRSFLLTNSLELEARVDCIIESFYFAANMRNVRDLDTGGILILGTSRREVDKYFNPRICLGAIFLRSGERETRTEEKWRILCRRGNKIALLSDSAPLCFSFGLIDANLGD